MIASRIIKKKNGFTLTELLVVIMIMVILMAIGGISILQNNSGRGLQAGVSVLESAINEARSVAISRGTSARMLINDDNSDISKYRRQILTVVSDGSGGWEPAFRAISLPSNVYLDSASTVNVTGGTLGALGTGSGVEFSRGESPSYRFIEFNKLGICSIGGNSAGVSTTPGATLVLGKGRILSASKALAIDGNQRAGIVVWRNGGTTTVNDVSQIQ